DQLKAIYDSNEKVAEEASDSYSCPEWVPQVLGTTDLNELWDKELLGVSICTPTETHCSLAKECLSHGISTLIEKPISFSLDEAYSLQEFHESLSNGT
ncbi:Gfo/Idh/MocA family oxidoreductase, partial [Mangrovimonas sp. AS39]|uniref:Gfo/Idh/MocA family oxidoreductase n=1 Tax=Mangrovimonas futianensis TaxID=2895523 RepID=UPI001E4D086C